MTRKANGGRVTNPNRRPETSATATAASVASNPSPSQRQEPADALFGIAGNSYGTPTWAMSDDELSGPERKTRGQQRAESLVDNGWRTRADRVIDELAATRLPFTAETVRARLADDAISPAAFGSRFSAAARRGVIRKTGTYVTAQRASRNAGVLAQWVGVR